MSRTITHSFLSTQVLATSTDTFAFTLVFILMLGVFLAASYQHISKKVKETSLRYKAISALNDRTAFADIKPEYIHWEALRSKSQFDSYDFDKHLQTILIENMDQYTAVLNDAAKTSYESQSPNQKSPSVHPTAVPKDGITTRRGGPTPTGR